MSAGVPPSGMIRAVIETAASVIVGAALNIHVVVLL